MFAKLYGQDTSDTRILTIEPHEGAHIRLWVSRTTEDPHSYVGFSLILDADALLSAVKEARNESITAWNEDVVGRAVSLIQKKLDTSQEA